jgi:hypothetical protein
MIVEQERDSVSSKRVFGLLLLALVIGAMSVAQSTNILDRTESHAPTGVASVAPRTIGIIEQTPIEETAVGLELRARQRRDLDQWNVDRDAGIAQIPIERAFDLLLEKGQIQ